MTTTISTGDKVKFAPHASRSWWANLTGTVKSTDDWNREGDDVRIYVRWSNGDTRSHAPSELVLVEG